MIAKLFFSLAVNANKKVYIPFIEEKVYRMTLFSPFYINIGEFLGISIHYLMPLI